jgi:hypothetical protein
VFDGLRKDDGVLITGPHGRFVMKLDSRRPVIFVAWDEGFAPIKSLVQHAMSLEIAEVHASLLGGGWSGAGDRPLPGQPVPGLGRRPGRFRLSAPGSWRPAPPRWRKPSFRTIPTSPGPTSTPPARLAFLKALEAGAHGARAVAHGLARGNRPVVCPGAISREKSGFSGVDCAAQ